MEGMAEHRGSFDGPDAARRFAGAVTAYHSVPWMPAPEIPTPEGGFKSPEFVLYDVTERGAVPVARLGLGLDVTASQVSEFLRAPPR
jgi:hypothetical protein